MYISSLHSSSQTCGQVPSSSGAIFTGCLLNFCCSMPFIHGLQTCGETEGSLGWCAELRAFTELDDQNRSGKGQDPFAVEAWPYIQTMSTSLHQQHTSVTG